jgi:hypothetical protein
MGRECDNPADTRTALHYRNASAINREKERRFYPSERMPWRQPLHWELVPVKVGATISAPCLPILVNVGAPY